MKLVLDVSVAVPVLFKLEGSEAWETILRDAESIIVPEIYVAELGNTIWKYVNYRDLDSKQGFQVILKGLGLVNSIVPQMELLEEAYKLAVNKNITVYDSMYLSLCHQSGHSLLSNDKLLNKIADQMGVIFK